MLFQDHVCLWLYCLSGSRWFFSTIAALIGTNLKAESSQAKIYLVWMLMAFTLLSFWNLIFLLFLRTFFSTVLLQILSYWNHSPFLGHDGVCFSHFYLLYFWKYTGFSAKFFPFILMGIFSNLILLQLQHTFSHRNRSTIKILSFFSSFNLVLFKSLTSSLKHINFQPLLVPHTLS